ncbi:DNA-binding ferritin-like protein [Streptomyces sp. M18.1]
MYVVKSPLSDANLKTVSEALQGGLVDLVDLALVAKQIHWNVVGPRFRSVHLQLDELVDTARAHSDTVAERASALGVSPDGRAATVAVGSGIDVTPEGWVDDTTAVQTIVDALGAGDHADAGADRGDRRPRPGEPGHLHPDHGRPGEAALDVPGGERLTRPWCRRGRRAGRPRWGWARCGGGPCCAWRWNPAPASSKGPSRSAAGA